MKRIWVASFTAAVIIAIVLLVAGSPNVTANDPKIRSELTALLADIANRSAKLQEAQRRRFGQVLRSRTQADSDR